MPPEGHFAKVNGIELYYEIHGQGEPLLLIHGFGGSGQDWAPVLEEFAKHYRVILPDMRGHGRSTNPTKQFTHRQSALDMFALLDLLGVKTFKAMGISSGGMTLLHMATQQPSRVEAMVLIGATSYFPEPARQIMRRSTVESMTAQEWERARRIHKYGDDQIRMLREQFHRFKDSYDDMNFTRPLLSTITAKTLIIHGDRDQFFPVSIPVEEYCAIPNSFLWIIPNGGHVPIAGNVQEFTRITLQFLSGAWDQSKKPWDCHAATEK
ncbi:MAG: alpha/beta hydrolase [Pyrinomonas methylaliphatogenes]|nr:alpha/beta hydrolase [Pyrinomonas methylaliphatogenes]